MSSILTLRKHPVVTVRAIVHGRAQLGYRPPMMIKINSLKDGHEEVWFQIRRAHLRYPLQEVTHVNLSW